MCLLISTHAIPPFSYRVPEHLADRVRPGSAVTAPLSGYPRLGIVVDHDHEADIHALEDIRAVIGDLTLSAEVVEACRWASEAAAIPVAMALRAALPPGLKTSSYRVISPLANWHWQKDEIVSRASLRKALGDTGFKEAERTGRVELAPALPDRGAVEWAAVRGGPEPDLSRAPRQRALFEALVRHGHGWSVSDLLSEAGAKRDALRQLVRRGAVRLERRPEPAPIFESRAGEDAAILAPFLRSAGRVVDLGGAWVWRTPAAEWGQAVAAVVLAASEGGEQTLVLVPERRGVDAMVRDLIRLLPEGLRIAPYHGGLGRKRGAVFEAAREGSVDVLVGTRSAALLPLARLGAVCVVDEPNGAHRAEPGFEGVPIHARDLAIRRGEIEGSGVLCLSPTPSLRLQAPENKVRELPTRSLGQMPDIRIVDMRGTGATFSPALLDTCAKGRAAGTRVGVVASRTGASTKVYCNGCGAIRTCPECGFDLSVHGGLLECVRCGNRGRKPGPCEECGSERVVSTGLSAERIKAELARALKEPVGLLTAGTDDGEDRRVIVGTAHRILDREWGTVILPDSDHLLLGSGMGAAERAFRILHGAVEVARERLLVQTRMPDHHALQTALRNDYPDFVATELPRLREAGYPPYAHLAALTFKGPENRVRRAVESELLPALENGVEASPLVPISAAGEDPAWRMLLRSKDRSPVARAGALAARRMAKLGKPGGPRVRVDVDPEEV